MRENPILYSFDKSFRKPESRAPLGRKGARTMFRSIMTSKKNTHTHTKQINKKTTRLRRDPRREVPAACLEYKIWFLFVERSPLVAFRNRQNIVFLRHPPSPQHIRTACFIVRQQRLTVANTTGTKTVRVNSIAFYGTSRIAFRRLVRPHMSSSSLHLRMKHVR